MTLATTVLKWWQTHGSEFFSEAIDAEDYVRTILRKFPYDQYKTKIDLFYFPSETKERVHMVKWEIQHG